MSLEQRRSKEPNVAEKLAYVMDRLSHNARKYSSIEYPESSSLEGLLENLITRDGLNADPKAVHKLTVACNNIKADIKAMRDDHTIVNSELYFICMTDVITSTIELGAYAGMLLGDVVLNDMKYWLEH